MLEVDGKRAGSADVEVESEALLLLGDIDQRQGRPGDAHERLARGARGSPPASTDPRLQHQDRLRARTRSSATTGEYEQAIENLRPAIALAEEIDDRALVAEGHLRIAALLMSRATSPPPRRSFAAARRARRRARQPPHRGGGYVLARDRAPTTAAGPRRPSGSASGRGRGSSAPATPTSRCRTSSPAWRSSLDQQNGRIEEAEARLREALPVALQIGGWVLHKTYWHLVEALVAQDRLDDAREIVAFAARNLPEEDPLSRAWLLLSEALVATADGESTAASTSFAEALRLLEELNYKLDIAEGRFVLGRSLCAFGDVGGARVELERARALFVLIGADIRRDAVDAVLAELVGGPAPAGPPTA